MFNSYDELKQFVEDNGITMMVFKVVDLNGRWHHLSVPASRLDPKIFEEGIGFDGSSYGYLSVEKSDMVFIPDISTAFVDPFLAEPAISMIGNIYSLGAETQRYEGDPRYIAEKAERFMKESGIADEFRIGPEFEFHVFDRVAYRNDPHHLEAEIDTEEAHWHTADKEFNQGYKIPHKGGYHAALPHDITQDLRDDMVLTLEELGVPVKYHHHEVGGPGQVEIEVERGPMRAWADLTLLVKYVVKNTAVAYGKTATFMPKPIYGEAGNGMHVHMHLFKEGKPLFYQEGGYADLSDMAMYFLGGILKHARSLLAFTNPSTNSYRRLVPGYEAPVSICFGTANRSSVVRIPAYAKRPEEKRYEFRPSDATCNPYLAFSAMLMAGLDGVINRIDPVKEGFGPYDTNIFALSDEERNKIGALPKNLAEALEALEQDHEYLLRGNVFTKELIQNWINLKRKEAKEVSIRPHPLEFALYYDL